jgi:hypothetical protein
MKYFNLSKPIQIKEFNYLNKPMGWLRLNLYNVKSKKKVLTKEEYKYLKEEAQKKLIKWKRDFNKKEVLK